MGLETHYRGLSGVPEGGSMRGWVYRLAVAVKDAGERWNIPPLIRLGLALKGRL
jgi:hypothetical protein